MKTRRLYYGWFDPKAQTYRVSRMPPDATIRPSVECADLTQVNALLKRYRAEIMWWPPLPAHLKPQPLARAS